MPENANLQLSEAGERMIEEALMTEEAIEQELQQVDENSNFSTVYATIAGLAAAYMIMAKRYSETVIPKRYLRGLQDSDSAFFKSKVRTGIDTDLHQSVVRKMSEQMTIDFGRNMRTVVDGIEYALTEAELINIRAAFAGGGGRANIRRQIEEILDAQSVRGKRNWKVSSYTDMLVRTTERKAFNNGVMNRALELNIVVFRISNSGSKHEECARWEGQYVSANGEFGLPSLSEVFSSGIFHPNCMHRLAMAAYKQRELEGRAIDV